MTDKKSCEYCTFVGGEGNAEILHDGEQLLVVAKDVAFIPGQLTVLPKEHCTILEMVPEELLAAAASTANKASTILFEQLGAQGTNILVQNGIGAGQKVPHFAVEVIPRREGDGLKLNWTPQTIGDDDLDIVAAQLKEASDQLLQQKFKKEEPKKEEVTITKEDYRLKALRRIP